MSKKISMLNPAALPLSGGELFPLTQNGQTVNTTLSSIKAYAAGSGVTSVFGRTGAVSATSGDYTFIQLADTPTSLSGYGIIDAAPLSHVGSGGSQHALATPSEHGFMSSVDKSSLINLISSLSGKASLSAANLSNIIVSGTPNGGTYAALVNGMIQFGTGYGSGAFSLGSFVTDATAGRAMALSRVPLAEKRTTYPASLSSFISFWISPSRGSMNLDSNFFNTLFYENGLVEGKMSYISTTELVPGVPRAGVSWNSAASRWRASEISGRVWQKGPGLGSGNLNDNDAWTLISGSTAGGSIALTFNYPQPGQMMWIDEDPGYITIRTPNDDFELIPNSSITSQLEFQITDLQEQVNDKPGSLTIIGLSSYLQSQIDTKTSTSTFSALTGSLQTQINTKVATTTFTVLTGSLQTQVNTKVATTTFSALSTTLQAQITAKAPLRTTPVAGSGASLALTVAMANTERDWTHTTTFNVAIPHSSTQAFTIGDLVIVYNNSSYYMTYSAAASVVTKGNLGPFAPGEAVGYKMVAANTWQII